MVKQHEIIDGDDNLVQLDGGKTQHGSNLKGSQIGQVNQRLIVWFCVVLNRIIMYGKLHVLEKCRHPYRKY